MPKLTENTVPSYRRHKQSGQAIVTLNGRDILLGPHGTAASRGEYRRQIAQWITGGRQLTEDGTDVSIAELIQAFKKHAEEYYRRPDGTPTDEVSSFRQSLRPLRTLFGSSLARDFGPLSLGVVRNEKIRLGWCRTNINGQVARIKHVFKWAVSKELVPASVHHALVTVAGLRLGRSEARESDPVKPVPDEVVDATLVHLSPTIQAMVQLQRLTGARPGGVCWLWGGGVERKGRRL